jgi:hypothetical protein
MTISIVPYDIGCEPSPSVPAETLLQDGWCTYLLFFAVSKTPNESERLDDLGVAVLKCNNCVISQFGCPNDEGLPEHPLFSAMADSESGVLEVVGSRWCEEIVSQMEASACRIRPDHYDKAWLSGAKPRHFIILLKERTFECIAESLVVERYADTFGQAFQYVIQRMKEH